MNNKVTLFAISLFASGAVLAETSLLEAVGKQAAKDAVTTAAPDAVKGAEAAKQTLDGAKALQESVENAPEAVQKNAEERVKEAAEEKIKQATPEEIKQGADALKTGKETAKQLKGKVDAAPKSSGEAVKAVKQKAKQKAAEKALDLLR